METISIPKPLYLINILFLVFLVTMMYTNYQIPIGENYHSVIVISEPIEKSNQLRPECYTFQESPRNHFDIENSNMFTSENNKSYIKIETDTFDFTLSNPVSRTHSMNPALPDGAKVITRKPNGINDLFIGDIVCFKNPNKNDPNIHYQKCHRIIEMDNDRILTKGDNNQYTDNWIYKNDVEDIVIGVLY